MATPPVKGSCYWIEDSWVMAKQSLLRDFVEFIKHEKKWWLIPLLVVLLLVSLLIIFAQSSPLAPFIYPFF